MASCDHDPLCLDRGFVRDDRKTRSSNLPKAIRDLEIEDPVPYVETPDSVAHKRFHGPTPTPCFLYTSASKEWLPSKPGVNRLGAYLSFSVSGGTIAKRFTINVKVAGSNVSKLRQSQLEFFLGQPGQIKDFACTRRDAEEGRKIFERPTVVHTASWTTCGGYGTGLEVAPDYDEKSSAIFKALETLGHYMLSTETSVHLVIVDTSGLEQELQAIQDANRDYKLPWRPYLDATGIPRCSWATFPKRADVKAQSEGLVPVPAQQAFCTIQEAHLILANGICLEYRQSPKNDPGGAWPNTHQEQTYLKKQLVALSNLWTSNASQRWWPVILNNAVESLSVYDPLDSMQSSHTTIQQIWAFVEEAFPWDEYQRNALRDSRKLRGHVGVVEGGAGTGKTTTLAGIAVSYACSGCQILLYAPTISQARAISEAVTEVFCQLH